MYIGYASLTTGVNSIGAYRTCTTKTYSNELIEEIISHNLQVLLSVLKYNKKNGIMIFRISSDIIPLASHEINKYDWQSKFSKKLGEIGKYIKDNKMRVSMHPGQYSVLNSVNSSTVEKTVIDLNYHTNFLDSLNLDKSHKIVLHVGGVYGNKEKAIHRFILNYLKLNDNIKSRLVIENDDKLYNIEDVLNISKQTGIPVIFDNLHHKINNCDKLSEIEWIKECIKTWKKSDGTCKIHYSVQNPLKKPGAHSEFIYINKFMCFYNNVKNLPIDIMLEVKDKNLSTIKCINTVNAKNIKVYQKEWAKYKYVILERSHNIYKELREYLKDESSFDAKTFYLYIEKALDIEPTSGSCRNGFDHVWGYFKKVCSDKEKAMYLSKLEKFNNSELKPKSMKSYLLKLSFKYDSKYLLDSYYFHY